MSAAMICSCRWQISKKTTAQGVNGAAFALLALDCGGYEIPLDPEAAVQATRDGYVDVILAQQNPDGGWSLGGGASDPDLTAMALQALAGYRSRTDVSASADAGLSCLAQMQQEDGAFPLGERRAANRSVRCS